MIRNHKEYRHSRERLSELEAELKKLSRSAVRPGEVASAVIDFKVSTLDTTGGLAVCEITYFHKGGPARHLHHEQDEWFYVLEGEHVIEVGDERYELGPRDSVLAPRKVDHMWAHVGEGMGRLIAAWQPAGEIEAFFDDLAKLGSSARREELRRAFSSHGLELTGPPLSIE
jgi:mannose-6-phosphate isomerase-like protein (cupin superfamily)